MAPSSSIAPMVLLTVCSAFLFSLCHASPLDGKDLTPIFEGRSPGKGLKKRAAFLQLQFDSKNSECSGCVIDDKWLLTSAHCVYDKKNKEKAKKISVTVNGNAYQGGAVLSLKDYYSSPGPATDIAMLILKKKLTDYKTFWLALTNPTELVMASAGGFGERDAAGSSGKLLWKGVILTKIFCPNKDFRGDGRVICSIKSLLPSGRELTTCRGDSGGPLYYTAVTGYWLWGVNSAVGFPIPYECGKVDSYHAHTSVLKYRRKILKCKRRGKCGDWDRWELM